MDLYEREQRLIGFLESVYTTLRVVPQSRTHSAGRRAGVVQLDEVRVMLAAVEADGSLHWRLEFALGVHRSEQRRRADMLLHSEALHTAVAASDVGWISRGGRPGPASDVAEIWVEELTELREQTSQRPTGWFGHVRLVGQIPVPAADATTLAYEIDPEDNGALLAVLDGNGAGAFLGVGTLTDESETAVEYSPGLALQAPVRLYIVTLGWIGEGRWQERESWRPEGWAPAAMTLAGTPLRTQVGPERFELRWNTERLPSATVAGLRAALVEAAARPLLLARPGGGLAIGTLMLAEFGTTGNAVMTWQAQPASHALMEVLS